MKERNNENKEYDYDTLYRLLWGIYGNDIAEQKFKDLTNTDYDKTEIYKAKEKEMSDGFSKSFENGGKAND